MEEKEIEYLEVIYKESETGIGVLIKKLLKEYKKLRNEQGKAD